MCAGAGMSEFVPELMKIAWAIVATVLVVVGVAWAIVVILFVAVLGLMRVSEFLG